MKTKWCAVAAACLFLFLSACSPSPQSLILGKWEVENAPAKMTAEFKSDGTASISVVGADAPRQLQVERRARTGVVDERPNNEGQAKRNPNRAGTDRRS